MIGIPWAQTQTYPFGGIGAVTSIILRFLEAFQKDEQRFDMSDKRGRVVHQASWENGVDHP